jgi:hypothetical protein
MFKIAQKNAVDKFTNPEFIKNIEEEDPTMVKHLNILKQINEYGYLTTNSQAGIKTENYEERSFIIGFMSRKDAQKFVHTINTTTDKIALSVVVSDTYADPKLDIPLTMENKKGIWKSSYHMSTFVPINHLIREKQKIGLNQDLDILYIFCWDPKWNRNASSKMGLFTDVLKILKTISI